MRSTGWLIVGALVTLALLGPTQPPAVADQSRVRVLLPLAPRQSNVNSVPGGSPLPTPTPTVTPTLVGTVRVDQASAAPGATAVAELSDLIVATLERSAGSSGSATVEVAHHVA